MFGLKAQDLLGLAVLAAIVTAAGNLLATVLKDFFFARYFEEWKERRTLMSVYRKYRDPIVLAGEELESRLSQICESYPPDYLRSEVLDGAAADLETNSTTDPHFKRYRLLSTVYRLCAFLGWLELYRQDLTFLDIGRQSENRRFEEALARLRSDLADGQLNDTPDWFAWRDRLIFREEQRAIGEAMIPSGTNPRIVVGYGTFCTLFARAKSDESLWSLRVACTFFLNLEEKKDFRRKRLGKMRQDLRAILEILRPEAAKWRTDKWRTRAASRALEGTA
jgi:hypothetical protein